MRKDEGDEEMKDEEEELVVGQLSGSMAHTRLKADEVQREKAGRRKGKFS